MNSKIKLFFIIICCFLIGKTDAQVLSKQNHNVNLALQVLKADKDLKNAGIGFYAVDVNTGEVISSYNCDLALTPASTQKLITTATALEVLGPNYKFSTKLEYVGKYDSTTNVLSGKLIIKGGGDPTLGSKYFNQTDNAAFSDAWIKAISDLGVKIIIGEVIGDERMYGYEIVPPTWSWEDMGNYFGAGANGLSVFDNMYTLYYNTSDTINGTTEITKADPVIPGMTFDNHVKADAINSDKSYIFGAPYTNHRYINGYLPKGETDYKIKGSMPDPSYFAAYFIKERLKENGISSGDATTFRLSPDLQSIDSLPHTTIIETISPPLSEIIKQTNYRSINLFAEHLYTHSKLKTNKFNPEGLDKNFPENFWSLKGIDTQGMAIYDGSGLSKYNTVTTKQMVSILKYMKKQSKYSEEFYESLAIVGKDGTVKDICKGTSAENNMRAKSGSIKAVRAYAGYVTSTSGRVIAFSLIINNYNGTSSDTGKKMQTLMSSLADFNL
jgi:D-alanyl-D-alanine carboxypeptidase/D-alanyl-D-alanine-endopeptidase (penicillin-binding protein 4)